MSARGRTARDQRRREFGQNFLEAATADRLVDQATFRAGELVVEIGAGSGAITLALARRGVRILAIEPDPEWARRLRQRMDAHSSLRVVEAELRVVEADFLAVALPAEPFRVVGSLPFGRTTDIMRRLLDDPRTPLWRADVIVQWEVACKRAAMPPSTLLSTTWAPWWDIRLGPHIPAQKFRPVPRVDAGFLTIVRRSPALLPPTMARSYAQFVRQNWPFEGKTP
jgi:23S rRNA (adenine-N6)-dimethyltransferase